MGWVEDKKRDSNKALGGLMGGSATKCVSATQRASPKDSPDVSIETLENVSWFFEIFENENLLAEIPDVVFSANTEFKKQQTILRMLPVFKTGPRHPRWNEFVGVLKEFRGAIDEGEDFGADDSFLEATWMSWRVYFGLEEPGNHFKAMASGDSANDGEQILTWPPSPYTTVRGPMLPPTSVKSSAIPSNATEYSQPIGNAFWMTIPEHWKTK